ncbi:MAG: hypothetical protein COA44_02185 [Arcobacter sp.]|nr:MAG: hypothetical protein COA44_02185 [Arcobacter sp.]
MKTNKHNLSIAGVATYLGMSKTKVIILKEKLGARSTADILERLIAIYNPQVFLKNRIRR